MAYQVLARKYRPQRFADVVGQDHVTLTLGNALAQDRIAHGYIFSGHRGIGKTTIARILAMALNCRNPIGSAARPTAEPCLVCESCTEIKAGNAVDVIEIDAATNRGIDEIRELRDAARYAPARDRYKIYILDEAHQITDAAFNALLKTLEEPPSHVVFMMATTQPEDIPQTVRSRCQHFSFHAVKLIDILGQLRSIASREGVIADESALALLAEAGDGSVRDALSIMDQAIASAPMEISADGTASYARLDASQIRELMGTVPNTVFESILDAVNRNDSPAVITSANRLLDAGNSPAQLARQCVRYLRNALIARIAALSPDGESADGIGGELLQISPDEQRRAARTAALFSEEELARFLHVMLRTFDELGYRQEQRFHFELGLLKLVHLRRLLPLEEVLSQLPTSTRTLAQSAAPVASSPVRPGTPSMGGPQKTHSDPRVLLSSAAPAPPSPPPAFSPFEQDNRRRHPEGAASTPIPISAAAPHAIAQTRGATAVSLAPAVSSAPASSPTLMASPALKTSPVPMPMPAKQPEAISFPTPHPLEERIEQHPDVHTSVTIFASVTPATQVVSSTPAEVEGDPRNAVLDALAAAGQASAADILADAAWTITAGEATIQTSLSKSMLPIVLNPDAEKIVRAILRNAGVLKLTLRAAASSAPAAKNPRPIRAGSLQARAQQHPMVQQAQRLFHAEIQTIIDLRKPD